MKETGFESAVKPAGVLRRFAAMVYDSLLLIAIFIIMTWPVVWIAHGVPSDRGFLPQLLFRLYLLAVMFVFFAWFWVHGGQTVGMRAWRLQLQEKDGGTVSWRSASLHFLVAIPALLCAGIGLWWIWMDRDHLAWHDRWSGTRMVVLPKPERS